MIQQLFAWLADPAHWQGPDGLPTRLAEHLYYTLIAVFGAAAIGIPLGLFVGHTGRGGLVLVGASNAMRALPTLGLVTFLFLLGGGSQVSTLIALIVLAVPPILAGTYAGVQDTDAGVVDAARGMGMTGWQRLWQVEVPNALPLLLGGLRNAMLQVVATAAVAAYVGLGGLGRVLLDGMRIYDYPKVVAGAFAVALLAVTLDLLLAGLQRIVVPRGLRVAARAAAMARGATRVRVKPNGHNNLAKIETRASESGVAGGTKS
ncbi:MULTISPECIES: ABC transporter permease subunit [unclassified Crossiella]|uniref:ABC transporter permease n=1 Tax=unclassified Crossiella TaxID=2620835 RepID=UPI001FFE9E73|nr:MULTISPECIES: ABC transporter permease subunit [unclassified Crossiella]MCK2243944.1 ABC transporter permease subunit [Crossiella sp. S99.2]MCK2257198.1 ABC transporter permease subunit [Crossiella sp. S99.1]